MVSSEEASFISRIMGDLVDQRAFSDLREAAAVAETQNALASLLNSFDAFCLKHEIRYFLFGDSLKGAICYKDFVPGAKEVQLGMTYCEFSKLRQEWQKASANGESTAYSWGFYYRRDDKKSDSSIMPRIKSSRVFPVKYNGEVVFDDDSFPMEIRFPEIEIAVFNAVPDDYLLKKRYFRQTRRWNRLSKRICSSRKTIKQGKNILIGLNLLYAFIPLCFSTWNLLRCASRYEGMGMSSAACVLGERSKPVRYESISSCERESFHAISVWIPSGMTVWSSDLVKNPDNDLNVIQHNSLEIIMEIHRVCSKLGLHYFICGGTLLGYVRYGGFIPWDDDMDIGMLRDDYERFISEAPGVIDSIRYFVQTRKSDPDIPYLYSKVRMNGTSYATEYSHYRDFHKGISVDIFPFDKLPDDVDEQKKMYKQAKSAAKKHSSLAFHQYPASSLKRDRKDSKRVPGSLSAFLVGLIMSKYYGAHSLERTQTSYERIVRRYNNESKIADDYYVGSFVPSFTMVKISDLLPFRKVKFEGIIVYAPANPDVFLRMQYGDYRQIPLPHEQIGHGMIDLNNGEA